MKQDNKGFSLVELIVAMAIFAIAGVAVFGFMVNSTNMFRRANVDIKLQYEQQLAINQIRDMVVESDKGIYFDEASKTLALYGAVETKNEGKEYPVSVIRFNSLEGKIYCGTKNFSNVDEITFAEVKDLVLLAEDVTEFNVDLTNVKNNKVVFQVTFKIGDKEQTVKETVALRNTLIVSNNVDTVWGDAGVIVNSFIKGITICRGEKTFAAVDTDTIGKLGDNVVVMYTAKVTANEDSTREYMVSWSMDETIAGISVSDSGFVTIASTVPNGAEFTLRATSVDDPSKSAQLNVKVEESAVYPDRAELVQNTPMDKNGYRVYKLVPSLYYTDGSSYQEYSRFTWVGLDSLPSGCSFDEDTGELILQSTANGYSFTIQAKAKERNSWGEVILSNEIVITAQDIPEYVAGTSVSLAVASSLPRGGVIFPTMVFKNTNSSAYEYEWKIEPYYDEESTKWGDLDNSDFNLVSLAETGYYDAKNVSHTLTTDANHRSIVLNCAPQLNWSRPFKLLISGSAVDKSGDVLTTDSKVVSIMPVNLTITPTSDASLYASAEYLSTDSVLRYENWNGGSIKQNYITRRCYTLNVENLFVTDTNKQNCIYTHNYLFKDAKGRIVTYTNEEKPTGIFADPGMLCGFEKKLYDWEKNAVPLPVYMNYSFTLKDRYGNSANSNMHEYTIAYELMK